MSSAWLFPGQDAFTPELGCALADDPVGGPLLARIEARTGVPVITRASRRRAARFDTAVVQGILTAVCLTLATRLRAAEGPPDVVAGHSLGALCAWALATGQPLDAVVDVALARGAAMAACARAHPGGMVAVAAADRDAALARGRQAGTIALAAHNLRDVWVLSGDLAAVRAVGAASRPVAALGPWHSPRLADAQPPFRAALAGLPPRALTVPWVSDGAPIASDAEGRAHLVDQLVAPVLWWDTLVHLRDAGVRDVVTIGPGRALRAMVRDVFEVAPREFDEGGWTP